MVIMKTAALTTRPASTVSAPLKQRICATIRLMRPRNSRNNAAAAPPSQAQHTVSSETSVQTGHLIPAPPQSKTTALNLSDLRGTLLHIHSMGQTWLQKILAQENVIKQQGRALTESELKVVRAGYEVAELKARLQASELRLMEERQASEILFSLTEKQAKALSSLREEVTDLRTSAAAASAAAVHVAALPNIQVPSARPTTPTVAPPLYNITLIYTTNTWGAVHVHHKADSKAWSQSPGLAMECVRAKVFQSKFPGCKRLEFVLTDGRGGWDKSPSGQNYVIEAPGIYSLENGRIVFNS